MSSSSDTTAAPNSLVPSFTGSTNDLLFHLATAQLQPLLNHAYQPRGPIQVKSPEIKTVLNDDEIPAVNIAVKSTEKAMQLADPSGAEASNDMVPDPLQSCATEQKPSLDKPNSVTHACPHCTFKTRMSQHMHSHLEAHQRHGGKGMHTCPECMMQFSQKANMHRHLQRHKGKAPYTCKDCTRTFYRLDQMQEHSMVHIKRRGTFDCPIEGCSSITTEHKKMEEHLNTDHAISSRSPGACKLCGNTFEKAHRLCIHYFTRHADCKKMQKRVRKHSSASSSPIASSSTASPSSISPFPIAPPPPAVDIKSLLDLVAPGNPLLALLLSASFSPLAPPVPSFSINDLLALHNHSPLNLTGAMQ